MDSDSIHDLKQFIAGTVIQQTKSLRRDIKQDIQQEVKQLDIKIDKVDLKLSTKIDNLSQSVAEAIDVSNDATATRLTDHEKHIGRLERKAA